MRLSRSDVAMVSFVLLGASALLTLFARDIGGYTVRTDMRPLGTIVFKKLAATRKAGDGFSWERMRNGGPVYQSDTLRTADYSEASIYFEDDTSLDILSNSMLRLNFGSEADNLEFMDGEITLKGSAKGSKYSISSAAGTITLGKESQATFSRKDDSLTVSVGAGKASLTQADGSVRDIDAHHELEVNVKSGEARVIDRPVIPKSPAQNARLIHYAAERAAVGSADADSAIPIAFEWERDVAKSPSTDGVSYAVELSRSQDFAEVAATADSAAERATLGVGDGTWYWRVRSSGGEVSPVRKFSLVGSSFSELAFPPDGREFSYRNKKPRIRFAWTDMAEASSYLFEASKAADFAKPAIRARTAMSSILVDSLDEGLWYWRVSPVHPYLAVGDVPVPAARTVRIAHRGDMAAIEPTMPVAGTLYQVQELDARGLAFSWLPDQEAVEYRFAVSRNADLSKPAYEKSLASPYIRLDGAAGSALRQTGQWYWGVRWVDDEGNVSPLREVRSLRGVDGSIAIRSSFPPDGYRVADSLAANTRFTWKSNIQAKTAFQVARDAAFTDIAYQEEVTADTTFGKNWAPGNYFWRLRTYNTDNTVFLDTGTRSFSVVAPFEGPVLTNLARGEFFYVLEGERRTLTWKPVANAEYYQATLVSHDGGTAKAILTRTWLTECELELELGDLPGGAYSLNVQAFASAGDLTTRIIGLIGENPFTYRRLEYIALAGPAKGASLPGLPARRGEAEFSCDLSDAPDSGELLIATDPLMKTAVRRLPLTGPLLRPGRLDPGRYYWTARGSVAGIDISARTVYSFDVEAIPPLPAPVTLRPQSGETFGVERLRLDPTIAFAWEAVPGATEYALELFREGTPVPVARFDRIRGESYTLADLSALDRGAFTWKVTALSYDAAGELERGGVASSTKFKIDLPALKTTVPAKGGKLYGK